MTDYSGDMLAHLARDCTTLCHVWRLTRRDGAVTGFTDHDRPLTVDGTPCEPGAGFTASEAKTSLGLAIDTVDVEGVLASDTLDAGDIAAGLFDDAQVETLLVNWRDVTQFASIRTAVIGSISLKDGRFLAELKSRMHALDQPNARVLARGCDAELGDGRCGKALGDFTAAGVFAERVAPDMYRVTGMDAFEPGWFSLGLVTIEGRQVRIVDHRRDGATVTFQLQSPGPSVEIGVPFTAVAGCDKRFGTCRTKFANGVNFRGFPHLPGNDAAYAYVTDGLVFDGGPLVP